MKKHLSNLLFILVAVICFSVTASAQKTDGEKGVRKPPIIVPDKDRQPKEDKPKDKKPQIISGFIQVKVGVDI